MQIQFHPIDQRPAPAPPPLRAGHASGAFGEEPRTAGLYRIKGEGFIPRPSGAGGTGGRHALAEGAGETGAAGARSAPSFGDFIDMINPLQHIPVVNLIYRGLTGDTIGGAAQIIGGALFGGPLGAVAGTANAIIEQQTGRTVADAALSAFSGESVAKANYARAALSNEAPIKRYNFNRSA